ncbi:MAG: ATP-binding protein [Aggregatilineales bacterium]
MIELIALILSVALVGAIFLLLQARNRLKAKDEEIQRKQVEFTSTTKRIGELDGQIEAKDQEIGTLRSSSNQKDETIVKKEQDAIQQQALIDTLQSQMTEQESSVAYRKALLLTLANAAYDSLIILDRDLKIIAINNAAEQLFNVESPLGCALNDVISLPEVDMMVTDALRNEEEVYEEQVRIDERFFRVRTSVVRRDTYSFIGLALQDITMLVRLNRARRDMVANISHELRHPIANIRLTIDSLFHDQDKPKRRDSITSLRAIARETENLMWLVQEMSDLAMIESGQSIVRMVDMPLLEIVDEAFEQMQDQSDYKSLTMVRHVPPKIHVLCDRDLARRVLINLIHNAIKWSPEGETITVNAEDLGDEVAISVMDNGLGVPPEKVERIFERFYQLDDSRSRGEGTGLGLAICKHIVEAHGGRIWAEGNHKGAGGRFAFTLLNAEEEISD